jgi:hypothetical protein
MVILFHVNAVVCVRSIFKPELIEVTRLRANFWSAITGDCAWA